MIQSQNREKRQSRKRKQDRRLEKVLNMKTKETRLSS